MESLQVLWEPGALNLLLARDRYASQSIRDEFALKPNEGSVPFDPEHGGHVTNVANHRYSVIWYESVLERKVGAKLSVAVVRAVVPALDIDGKPSVPKAYVASAVKDESKGAIKLS